MKTNNIIQEKTFAFAIRIVNLYKYLVAEKKEFVLSKQLLRSGTSIGANVREAQNAESDADFIHKLKIAAKEADETEYWLILCQRSRNYPEIGNLSVQLQSIIKVLSKIISTTKNKGKI